jgi:hypothetical protein
LGGLDDNSIRSDRQPVELYCGGVFGLPLEHGTVTGGGRAELIYRRRGNTGGDEGLARRAGGTAMGVKDLYAVPKERWWIGG